MITIQILICLKSIANPRNGLWISWNLGLTYTFMTVWVIVGAKRAFYALICGYIEIRGRSGANNAFFTAFLVKWFFHWAVQKKMIRFLCFCICFDVSLIITRYNKMWLERWGDILQSYTFFGQIVILLPYRTVCNNFLTNLILKVQSISSFTYNFFHTLLQLMIKHISCFTFSTNSHTFMCLWVIFLSCCAKDTFWIASLMFLIIVLIDRTHLWYWFTFC